MANLDKQLDQLENAELIRQLVEEELMFVFKHALLQHTAYESLLKHDRKRLHRRVGEALEALYPDQSEELAALLGRHFALAGERDKAIAYLRQAARHAVERFAYDEAIQQLRQALELLSDANSARPHVLEELGDVHRLMREGLRAIARYREALAAWEKIASVEKIDVVRLNRKIVEALSEIKWAIKMSDFYAESRTTLSALASLEAELEIMERTPHPELARLLTALSIAAWRIQSPSNWDAGLRYAQEAIDIAEKLNNPVELSAALDALASVHFARGELRENLRIALQRLALSRDAQFGDVRQRLDAIRGAGSALTYVGEYVEAIPYLLDAGEIAQRVIAVDQQFNVLSLLSLCYLRLDRWDDVLTIEDHVRDLASRYPRERTGPT